VIKVIGFGLATAATLRLQNPIKWCVARLRRASSSLADILVCAGSFAIIFDEPPRDRSLFHVQLAKVCDAKPFVKESLLDTISGAVHFPATGWLV
jgi:hypothetical protein